MTAGLVAVTGATGQVGARVAARLAERGLAQRLVVRDPARAPRHPGAEVRRIAGYAAGDDVRAALDGVGTLFLVPAAEAPDRVAEHRTVVDAAAAAGVQRIVYLSFVGAARDATFALARDHWHTEEHVRATGLACTLLRMSLYLDFLPSMVAPDGVLRGPAGDGRVAAVLRDDVAAAAAAAREDPAHDGRTYELTGPEAFSFAQAAARMAAATGRPVCFEDQTEEEAFASRATLGAPAFAVRGWVSSYLAVREGLMARVSPHVRELTGREPVGLDAYLRARPDALDHVGAGDRAS